MQSFTPTPTRSNELRSEQPVPVTVDDFVRAETDRYFTKLLNDTPLGRFSHARSPTPVEDQRVIRMNRDTLYSSAVCDLDAGPVTVTLPDSAGRYMMLQVINEDHYTQEIAYAPAKRTFTRETIGTRYAAFVVRTMVDPRSASDLEAVAALQDVIEVEQPGGPGEFHVRAWHQGTLTKIRDALKVLGSTALGYEKTFGKRAEVDPVHFLIGAAVGWGGNPPSAAVYRDITPPDNDGHAVHEVVVRDVPVDGFWSVSVYDAAGFFVKNAADAYSVNDVTAKRAPDGSVRIRFGGREPGGNEASSRDANWLPVTPGWTALARLYRPRQQVLDGIWTFPKLQRVEQP